MRVTVAVAGWEFPIEISPQEKVIEIKRKIQELLSVPMASQSLTIWGWEMIDQLDMEEYFPIITNGTKIHLTLLAPTTTTDAADDHGKMTMIMIKPSNNNKIHITLNFPAGRKIEMEVNKHETIRSLKEKIHIVNGIPINRMSLYFLGNELDNDFQSFQDYGFSNDNHSSEIIVFLKNATAAAGARNNTIASATSTPISNYYNYHHHNPPPPSKNIRLLVQASSCLVNGACIPLEISDQCTTVELNNLLLSRGILPRDGYIYIHKQRIMKDNCSLRWHGVENGDFLYVFKGTISRGDI